MLDRIIEICLRNRFLVVCAFILIILWGIFSINNTPIDAIPDIGEMQVIVFADWPGRSPKDVQDQVVYPLTTRLLGTPGVKVIRSSSDFGIGMVYLIFKEGVDYYWARTRVLERLNFATSGLPEGAMVSLGPDATALGQIFWYTVENGYYCPEHPQESYEKSGKCPIDGKKLISSHYDLSQLRSLQDWYVRYQLNSVSGVSEVGSVGGYVKQYQIDVDPNKLLAYDVKLMDVLNAVKRSNIDIGAKVFEEGSVEFIIRGVGFIKTIEDIENIVISSHQGTPVYVKNIGSVVLGPDFRRGALDREGKEVTGGVVVMRYGENPLKVIEGIKKKIEDLKIGLPPGIRVVPFYDRTGLIKRSINTLSNALIQEILITVFIIVVFLLHLWGSMVISIVLPIGVLISFILMRIIGVDANIMSLGGIAIAIGVMVDSGCVLVENIYRRIAEARQERNLPKLPAQERLQVCIKAAQEVGKPVLFALLTTIIGFIPVFVLTGQAGKLFRPLAFTKTFAMAGAAVIALTLLPTLSYYLLRGKLRLAEDNFTSRILFRIYRPAISWAIDNKNKIAILSLCLIVVGITSIFGMGNISNIFLNKIFFLYLSMLIVFKIILKRFLKNRIGKILNLIIKISLTIVFICIFFTGLLYITARLIHITSLNFPYISIFLKGVSILMVSITLIFLNKIFLICLVIMTVATVILRLIQKKDIARSVLRIIRLLLIFVFISILFIGFIPFNINLANTTFSKSPYFRRLIDWSITGIPEEFMPPLNEGDLLFMPVLLPGASLTQVQEVLKKQDIIIKKEFPDEVEWVVGKLGRAETATDPAPVIMLETIVHLKDKKFWRNGLTREKLIEEIQDKTRIPGVSPIMTQPIRNRIDMLATGIQTPVGIKVFGADLKKIEEIAIELERIVSQVKGAVSPFAERFGNRPYFEIEIDRIQAARYGLKIDDIQEVIMTAIGGENLTTTVEGRERYPVRIRYMRELRDNPEALNRIFVSSMMGEQVPLSQVARLKKVLGPSMIQAENTLPYARIFINVNQEAIGLVDFVKLAQKTVDEAIKSGKINLPAGYYISWSGQFESEMESRRRLIPSLLICLAIILLLLYMAFKSFISLVVVATGLPVSLMGGIVLLFILGFKFSTAVWVGFIALFGVATDNAVVLVSCLDDLFKQKTPRTTREIKDLVIQGGLLRVRPAMMTTMTTIIALIPVMLSTGTGSEVMKPMASPTVGGLVTATLSNLILVPVLYCWLKERQFNKDNPVSTS